MAIMGLDKMSINSMQVLFLGLREDALFCSGNGHSIIIIIIIEIVNTVKKGVKEIMRLWIYAEKYTEQGFLNFSPHLHASVCYP